MSVTHEAFRVAFDRWEPPPGEPRGKAGEAGGPKHQGQFDFIMSSDSSGSYTKARIAQGGSLDQVLYWVKLDLWG